jgi:hypothetical protein
LLSFFNGPEDFFGTENLVRTKSDVGSLKFESNCLWVKECSGGEEKISKADLGSGKSKLKDVRFIVYQFLALWLGLNKFLGVFLRKFFILIKINYGFL